MLPQRRRKTSATRSRVRGGEGGFTNYKVMFEHFKGYSFSVGVCVWGGGVFTNYKVMFELFKGYSFSVGVCVCGGGGGGHCLPTTLSASDAYVTAFPSKNTLMFV